jgi:TonB-linked SusC/RagA family outer membrane protein
MKLYLLILQLICLFSSIATGQPSSPQGEVRGRVISLLDQHPLIGVNVVIAGTSKGIITDVDGSFVLETVSSDTLIFSYVGYETLTLPVDGRSYLEVSLVEDINTLMEIEIFSTGYQELPKERATGSFDRVDNQLFNRSVGTDVIERLNGVASSVLFDTRSGGNKLIIRGHSTIFGNADPLVVVDNFPYDGDINNLNPNDIESVTVLKDAAAASIWGVRAGNGVIVITTKKGRKSQPLQVNVSANVTIGDTPDLYYEPRMSTSDFIDMEQFLFDQGYYDAGLNNTVNPPALSPVVELLAKERDGAISSEGATAMIDALRSRDVRGDLENYFYQRSVKQQYALNLNGGGDAYTYYFSTGLDKNLSSSVGNAYDRFSLDARQTFTPIKNLEFGTSLSFTQSKTERNNALSNIGMTSSQELYPYARLADDAGNPLSVVRDYRSGFALEAPESGLLDWTYTPMEELDLADDRTKLYNTRLGMDVNYTLLKGLNAEVKYQYQRQAAESRNFQGPESYYTRNQINRYSTLSGDNVTRNIPLGGILYQANNNLSSHNGRGQLTYNHEWDQHSISALAGFEVREIKTDGHAGRLYGFDEETGQGQPVDYTRAFRLYPSGSYAVIPGVTSVSGTVDRFRSWFVNAAYTYLQRYTVSLSGRMDQSNLFGVRTNQKTAPLWSAGLKWAIDGEGFYNVDWLPLLSLRTTYGYNGNVDQSVTAYTTGYYGVDFYHGLTTIGLSTPPNPELRWERSGIFNIGMDFETANNILSGSVEYYRKKGVDIMGYSPLDPTSGFSSYKGNVANTKGHGWDVELHSQNIDKDFAWQTDLLFSYVVDEVTDYPQEPTSLNSYFIDASLAGNSYYITPTEGRPLYGIYSYRWAGLDPATGDPLGYLDDEASNDYAAISSIVNTPVEELVYHGPALPPVFGALRNTVSYKGWSLSFNITYRFGYWFRSRSVYYSELFARYITHSDYEKRWQQPGDEMHTSVPSMIYPASSARDLFYSRSEVLVEKGDNIRLQDVRLSYAMDRNRFATLPVRQVEVYCYASNLGMIWKANGQGIDPDFPDQKLPLSISFGIKAGL